MKKKGAKKIKEQLTVAYRTGREIGKNGKGGAVGVPSIRTDCAVTC